MTISKSTFYLISTQRTFEFLNPIFIYLSLSISFFLHLSLSFFFLFFATILINDQC